MDTADYSHFRVAVDLDALRRNARRIRDRVGVPLLFTLKKDAYGHGALACARALEPESPGYFAVYWADEGIALRREGIRTPILVFAVPQCVEEAKAAIAGDLTLTVTGPASIALAAEAARELGVTANVHLKVDTGMGRVGFPAEDQSASIKALQESGSLLFEGVFSHLADSEDNEPLTARQTERFCRFVETLSPRPRICHLANSGGALRGTCRMDMARIGIALYGGTPLYDTEPVMSAFSRIAQVRWYEPGETISYGATYQVERRMCAGVVPGGYGDGILRSLSNAGSVMIRGRLAPIIGRVCMDQVIVDLSAIPEARQGDEALFFGARDGVVFPAWENANAAGTISYELTTLIGRLAARKTFLEAK